MKKLFYILGKSCSGKTTLLNRILGEGTLPLHRYIEYTDRPIRSGEVDGLDYHFVDDLTTYKDYKFIETREYNTINGVWRYGTAIDDQFNYDYLITVGPLGRLLNILPYYKDKICVIYINYDTITLLSRGYNRENSLESQNYKELIRRLISDNKQFDESVICNVKKYLWSEFYLYNPTNIDFATSEEDKKMFSDCFGFIKSKIY